RQVVQLLSGDDEDLIPEKPDPVISPETAHFPRRPPVVIPPKAYPDRYKFRVFEVHCVVVKQRVLERVIATCPDLRVFKLHDINEKIWVPELSVTKHYPIDEERLWDHMWKCCSKMEWYHLFPMATTRTDETVAFGRMHWNKGFGRFMTTVCNWSLRDYTQDLEVRSYLRNITVLEVLPTLNFAPSAASESRNVFNSHNRTRKLQERQEKRQKRLAALERFQGREHDRLSVPDVWQCRNLRSMVTDFLSNFFGVFTQYIRGHHLLRNLTSLSITINALRIGQLKSLSPPVPQFPEKSTRKSKGRAKTTTAQAVPALSQATAVVLPPERWENDFLLLRGLRCLERLDVAASKIEGKVQATDFEFLRKQSHSHVMLFIADKNKDASSDEDEDSATNERCGRRKDRTFWPHLQAFHIKYMYTDLHVQTNFADIVAGVEHIRPGVEFVIKKVQRF
ncbi:hypothetical protein EC968_009112, partial [Mortierella alpina]